MKLRLSQDMWVLVVLGIFLVGIGYVGSKHGGAPGEEGMFPKRTSYSSRPGGLLALYKTLDHLGYHVKRKTDPLTSELDEGVLVIAAPETTISPDEWNALRHWVEKGNILILSSNDFLLRGITDEKVAASTPTGPSFLSPNASSFQTPELSYLKTESWEFKHGDNCQSPFG